MGKIFSYSYVYDLIKKKGCTLLSKTYENAKQKLELKCKCGNIYYANLNTFSSKNKTMCDKCKTETLKHRAKKYTIEEVGKIFYQDGNKLLSMGYINRKENLSIQCSCGNIYYTSLSYYLTKKQNKCELCREKEYGRRIVRLTYEEVKKHVEDKGCKLISTTYKNSTTKMDFACKCGTRFTRTLNKFKNGQILCLKCSNITQWDIYSVKYFIEKYSKSNCILISDKYLNLNGKLHIKCACGTVFITEFTTFKNENKRKCDECAKKIFSKNKTTPIETVKKYIEENSECKLVSKVFNGYSKSIELKCTCGNTFVTSFSAFKNGKRRCNICSPISKMEEAAEAFFINNKIKYISQYKFSDLKNEKNNRMLRFDFAVFDYENNIKLLELDGEQHFRASKAFGGEEKLKKIQKSDVKKNKYCEINKIPLYRISYKQQKNLTQELEKIFLL